MKYHFSLLIHIIRAGLFALLLFICEAPGATAQNSHPSKTGNSFAKYQDKGFPGYDESKKFYVTSSAQLTGSAKLVRRISDTVSIVELRTKEDFKLMHLQSKISVANNHWKFSPACTGICESDKEGYKKFILTALDINKLLLVLEIIKGYDKILYIDNSSRSVVIQSSKEFICTQVQWLDEVIFIDLYTTAHPETNIIGYDRSFHGINAVDYEIPGANGTGIVAGVKEQQVEKEDLDLYKRVLSSALEAGTVSNHATVIASIIGGAGNSFYDGRGIAYGCKFFPSSFANLFVDDPAVLNNNKVTVQNHSYGTIIQQFYGAEAVSYDEYTWQNKTFIPVFSAGNRGLDSAGEGTYANVKGHANLTGNFKNAKNVITVGAIDNKGNIAPESSAGPTYDGRLAPQLAALGPNGSSDAAAMVSGTIAVMQQVFADSNNRQLPPASLVKAVLYNSAFDLHRPGIDYKTGYGLLDSYEAVKSMQQKSFENGEVAQDQVWTTSITVPQGTAELKVTLAWTDSTGLVNNNKALVNDLDLELVAASGDVFKPWVLSSIAARDSLEQLPVRRRDSLNTAEQVSIRMPLPGSYLLRVKGQAIPGGSQTFHVAYKNDALNSFKFLSPQHASDVNPEESPVIDVKWKTFVSDSNQTGDLYISYTRGDNWQPVEQAVKIYKNSVEWQIPDTSATAMFKMETAFGVFFSREFVVSKVVRPRVDFVCADSFRLSWNPHVYASSYTIFGLTDDPYLQPLLTVGDTFVVLNRAINPAQVYAVEPILNNGLKAARSTAIDVNLQGVRCFYKTLNYNLLDSNHLNLLLELSIASYTDSVYFEKVTPAGQLLQTYGGDKVVNNRLVYTQLVNDVAPGITYLRGRIHLKNGSVLYTDIIPVLTSGKKIIQFYPNPASRSAAIKYVLQQGIAADSQLQLFDANGRQLKNYAALPATIDISDFPPGLIMYRLLNPKNQLLETGKIIIY